MKKKVDILNVFIKLCISLFIVVPILNVLILTPSLGLIGLINKLDVFEIKSLIFILICVIIISLIALVVSILTFILFKNKKYNINVNVIISAILYAIAFFVLSYSSYGSNFLMDLISGIDLTDSIFKMIVYLMIGILNVCIVIDYVMLLIMDEIIKAIKK